MTELRTIADANISTATFGLIEDFTDVPRTDPDDNLMVKKGDLIGVVQDQNITKINPNPVFITASNAL